MAKLIDTSPAAAKTAAELIAPAYPCTATLLIAIAAERDTAQADLDATRIALRTMYQHFAGWVFEHSETATFETWQVLWLAQQHMERRG